ncbi:protein O-mannosyl-transferase family [Planctomycetes bacterium Pla163]|uniref:protein O-mannosyl-transferase family n=1 Tax=Rohdeia mirabilis TaxID=2528008 RepID=UPI0011A9C2AF
MSKGTVNAAVSERRGRARALGLGLLAVAATLAYRVFSTTALDEDGPGLVRDVTLHTDSLFSYYHVAYGAFGRLVARGLDGHVLSALLWTSAGAAGLCIALFARAALHVGGVVRCVLATTALFASAGLWTQATRVEVHAMQAVGAAALLVAATRHVGTVNVRGAVLLALAAALALPCHSSNLLLLPGVWWIAARRGDRELTVPLRNAVLAAAALATGAAVGWWINSLSTMSGESGPTGNVRYLVEHYFTGFSTAHLSNELLIPWGVALVVTAALVLRTLVQRLRESDGRPTARLFLPFFAAALPGLAFFLVYGIPTSGGYFVSPVVFLLAGAAAIGPDPRGAALVPVERVRVAALALGIAAAGAFGVHAVLTAPARLANEAIGDARFDAVRALAPAGGILVGAHLDLQLINGRDPRFTHSEVAEALTPAILGGAPPERFARRFARLGTEIGASGTTIVIDRGWMDLAAQYPPFTAYMQAIEAAIGETYALEPAQWNGHPYLVGRPRTGVAKPPGAEDEVGGD